MRSFSIWARPTWRLSQRKRSEGTPFTEEKRGEREGGATNGSRVLTRKGKGEGGGEAQRDQVPTIKPNL